MALIKCPKCGKEFSARALACPQCGFKLKTIIPIQLALVVAGILMLLVVPIYHFGKLYEFHPMFAAILRWCWEIFLCAFWLSQWVISQFKEKSLVTMGLICCILWIICVEAFFVFYGNYSYHGVWQNYSYNGMHIFLLIMGVIIILYGRFLNGIEKYLALTTGISMLLTQCIFHIIPLIFDIENVEWLSSLYVEWLGPFYLHIYPDFLADICFVAFVISCNISSWKGKL